MGFDFEIGQKVTIVELERTGLVISIWINKAGVQYEVRYFDKAEAKTVYFYPSELKK